MDSSCFGRGGRSASQMFRSAWLNPIISFPGLVILLLCLLLAVSCQPAIHLKKGQVTTVYLDARADWLSTGLRVERGQKLAFECKGTWAVAPSEEKERWPDTGPAGHGNHPGEQVHRLGDPKKELPGTPFGALLGRIGPVVFAIGDQKEMIMPADGELCLVINDYPFYRQDNRGGLSITISVKNDEPVKSRHPGESRGPVLL